MLHKYSKHIRGGRKSFPFGDDGKKSSDIKIVAGIIRCEHDLSFRFNFTCMSEAVKFPLRFLLKSEKFISILGANERMQLNELRERMQTGASTKQKLFVCALLAESVTR